MDDISKVVDVELWHIQILWYLGAALKIICKASGSHPGSKKEKV